MTPLGLAIASITAKTYAADKDDIRYLAKEASDLEAACAWMARPRGFI